MDHLHRPSNLAYSTPRVRHVARAYDGGSFLGYPDRHPLPRLASLGEFESFVQTWLYFGLLHEVFGEAWEPSAYVQCDADGAIVRSAPLIGDLDSWVERSRAWVADRRHNALKHISACLERASLFTLYARPFDRLIRQAIAALGQAVSDAVELAADSDCDISPPSGWSFLYFDDVVHHNMRRHGWCSTEILRAAQSLRTVNALCFVEQLSKPDRAYMHDHCTDQLCHHVQIDPDTYRPQHVDQCECAATGPSTQHVMYCLMADTYPILRIAGSNPADISIEVIPYSDRTPYVALSHVWSHGLGNPDAMQLPRCQLLRLKQTIEGLRQHVPAVEQELFMWCDTLCCPVEPRSKQLALRKMREIYQNAACVLVLDQCLVQQRFENIGVRGASVHLSTSAWTGRLWTLQECALARTLFVVFADRVVNMRHLLSTLLEVSGPALNTRVLDLDIAESLTKLTGFTLLRSGPSQKALISVVEAIRFRRASIASDEPLCLATLLDFDLRPLTDVGSSERMRVFWATLAGTTEGIPKHVIFHGYRRLDGIGFRWAPATLIASQPSQDAPLSIMESHVPNVVGKLNGSGLEVMYPAVQLDILAPPIQPMRRLDRILKTYRHKVPLRHHTGQWYEVSHLGDDEDLLNSTLWNRCWERQSSILVMSQIPQLEEYAGHDALFAMPHQPDTNVIHAHLKVVIQRTAPDEAALWEAARIPGGALGQELRNLALGGSTTEETLCEKLITRSRELAHGILQHQSIPVLNGSYVLRMGVITQDPLSDIATVIAMLATGQYLTTVRDFASDTKWIVD